MTGHKTAGLGKKLTAVDATHHHAVGNDGSGAMGEGFAIVCFLAAPELLASDGIEGDQRRVVGCKE